MLSTGSRSATRPEQCPERSSGAGTAHHRETFLELGPLPTAAACARGHTVNVVAEWGFAPLADDAALVVSELVTNAVAASAALDGRPPIGLRLSASDGRVVIEVWDYSAADVATLTPDDDAECGCGMVIVDAVAHQWGQSRRGLNRKVVWAVFES